MARPFLALISLLLLAAAIVLEFFVILSGGVNSSPEDKVYFLQADTQGIPNARSPSRWTYWAICGADDFGGRNTNCGSAVPALPFSPTHPSNFDTTSGIPPQFIGTKHYYYLSRFAWVFYLIALLFSATALFTGLLALCTRFGAYLSGLTTFLAFFWQALASSLMTAWTVQGRNAFRKNGHRADLGKYAYGFSWGAVAVLFISTLAFCMAGSGRKSTTTTTHYNTSTRRRGFFRRHRSVRSRKDEYA
jgi:hypothetical protein